MLQAFCATEQQLDLYIAPTNGSVNYQQIIESFCLPDSVQVHYTDGVIPYLLAQKVARKKLCCHLLYGFSLYRRPYHIGRSLCIRHPCHLLT